MAITYPDIDIEYYGKEHVLEKVAPKYYHCMREIVPIVEFCEQNDIHLKLPDFPFCVFPMENRKKYIQMSDDYDYHARLKIMYNGKQIDKSQPHPFKFIVRERCHLPQCNKCPYKNECWGPAFRYKKLYGADEIRAII